MPALRQDMRRGAGRQVQYQPAKAGMDAGAEGNGLGLSVQGSGRGQEEQEHNEESYTPSTLTPTLSGNRDRVARSAG